MAINYRLLFISSIVLLAVAFVTMMMFPLDGQGTKKVYDYTTQQNTFEKKPDYTGVILVVIESIALFTWLVSQLNPRELTIIRTGKEILYDPASSPSLTDNHVILPCTKTHEELIGQFSLGYLKFMRVLNTIHNSVWIIAVADKNYDTTETRPQLTCPIITISEEIGELFVMRAKLPPSERKSFERQLEAVLKGLENKPPELKEYLVKKAEENIEEAHPNGN